MKKIILKVVDFLLRVIHWSFGLASPICATALDSEYYMLFLAGVFVFAIIAIAAYQLRMHIRCAAKRHNIMCRHRRRMRKAFS